MEEESVSPDFTAEAEIQQWFSSVVLSVCSLGQQPRAFYTPDLPKLEPQGEAWQMFVFQAPFGVILRHAGDQWKDPCPDSRGSHLNQLTPSPRPFTK